MAKSKSPAYTTEPLAVRIDDASRMIGLGRTSIYELINEGKLKTIKVAGRRLVLVAAIRELLASADTGEAPPHRAEA